MFIDANIECIQRKENQFTQVRNYTPITIQRVYETKMEVSENSKDYTVLCWSLNNDDYNGQ